MTTKPISERVADLETSLADLKRKNESLINLVKNQAAPRRSHAMARIQSKITDRQFNATTLDIEKDLPTHRSASANIKCYAVQPNPEPAVGDIVPINLENGQWVIAATMQGRAKAFLSATGSRDVLGGLNPSGFDPGQYSVTFVDDGWGTEFTWLDFQDRNAIQVNVDSIMIAAGNFYYWPDPTHFLVSSFDDQKYYFQTQLTRTVHIPTLNNNSGFIPNHDIDLIPRLDNQILTASSPPGFLPFLFKQQIDFQRFVPKGSLIYPYVDLSYSAAWHPLSTQQYSMHIVLLQV